MLAPQTVMEVLQGTKSLAGTCFIASQDPDASPEEVALLTATLEALHRQGAAFSLPDSEYVGRAFRSMPATCFGPCRPPVSVDVGRFLAKTELPGWHAEMGRVIRRHDG